MKGVPNGLNHFLVHNLGTMSSKSFRKSEGIQYINQLFRLNSNAIPMKGRPTSFSRSFKRVVMSLRVKFQRAHKKLVLRRVQLPRGLRL